MKNSPLIIKYGVDTCDVATPWRRACTDAISNMYVPLFNENLDFTNYENALEYHKIYEDVWEKIKCECPFCKDMSIKEIASIYKKSDKRKTNKDKHSDNYYHMRVRIFYHNLFQHIALLKKLDIYKRKHGNNFLKEFIKDVPQEKIKRKFSRLV